MEQITLFKRFALFWALVLAVFLPGAARSQVTPPGWSSTESYAAGAIVQYSGNWYRAMTAISAGTTTPAADYGKWELNFVRANTTLTIGTGQQFANLVYAWQFGRNAQIANGAYLHLNIVTTEGNFSESFSAPFYLDHGFGSQISIAGDTKANIILKFPTSNGLWIDNGHALADMSGLTVNGFDGKSISTNEALTVVEGANIGEVSNLEIEGFGIGVYSAQNASLYMDPSTTIADCNTYLWADESGAISYGGFTSTLSPSTEYVFFADRNATISAENVNIQGTNSQNQTGAYAANGAVIDLNSATLSHFDIGCQVVDGGRVIANSAVFQQDSHLDLMASTGGTISAIGVATPIEQTGANDGSYIYTS